ncbi:glycosyl hydrolase family 28-related protein [Aquirhabdus sp.]|uniref:glycosyl hydrolase family 28-related protein n=1 Tax=Aquirhabdus sp. TaxID=2824160 RepID=UPI00396CB070
MMIINVKDAPYNAIGDGVVDDTNAIQTAINTGYQIYMPEGTYHVKDKITLKNGQILRGDGRTKSYFLIQSDFNMSASGVLRLGTAEPGAQVFDIGFRFVQPATTVDRSTCLAYPPAIDMNALPRSVIDRIRIENGWAGISAKGNCGGSYIGFIEVGALSNGLTIDGPADFFHGGHWHFWPFGIAGKAILNDLYYDGVASAFSLGACDGLTVDSISTFSQKIVIAQPTVNPAIPTLISKLQLDGNGARLLINQGNIRIGQAYSTKSPAASVPTIDVSSGTCIIDSFACSSVLSSSEVHTSNTGSLTINGGEVLFTNINNSFAKCDGGYLSLNGIKFLPSSTSAYLAPHVLQVAGSVVVKNCSWNVRGTGSGVAVQYTSDNASNYCSGNNFNGWQYSGQAGILGSYTQNNNAGNGDIITNDLIGDVLYKNFVVDLDAAGKYVGAHNISSGHLKVLFVQAFSKGPSSEANPMALVYLDGGNVSVSGGLAGSKARITIAYTSVASGW